MKITMNEMKTTMENINTKLDVVQEKICEGDKRDQKLPCQKRIKTKRKKSKESL